MLVIGRRRLGGLLLLGIAVFLFRRRRRKATGPAGADRAGLPAAVRRNLFAGAARSGPGREPDRIQLAERDALQAKADAQALSSLKLAPVITKKAEVFAKHLREKIAKEPEISAQILRSWIRDEEED